MRWVTTTLTRFMWSANRCRLRGLSQGDLLPLTYEDEDDDWAEKSSIRVVDSKTLAAVLEEQDVVLSF